MHRAGGGVTQASRPDVQRQRRLQSGLNYAVSGGFACSFARLKGGWQAEACPTKESSPLNWHNVTGGLKGGHADAGSFHLPRERKESVACRCCAVRRSRLAAQTG